MEIHVKAEIKIPKVPNFLLYKHIDGKVAIGHLSDLELREVGAAWIENLIQRAKDQRFTDDWTL